MELNVSYGKPPALGERQMTRAALELERFASARSLGRCKETPLAKGSKCPDFHSQLQEIRSDRAFSVQCWSRIRSG